MALSGTVNGNVTYRSQYFTFYFTWSATQSVAGNYSDVTVKTYIKTTQASREFDTVGADRKHSITINGTAHNITKRIDCEPWPSSLVQLIQEATTRVYHNSDGTKSITISARSNGTASTWGYSASQASANDATASATITLNTIPRKSTMSVSKGTLEEAQTITVTKAASGFTHTLTWHSGDHSGTIATKSSATSLSFTPSADLANGAPNGNEVWVGFTLTTYNGDTVIGTDTKSAYMTIPDTDKYNPVISDFSVTTTDTFNGDLGNHVVFGKTGVNAQINVDTKYSSTVKSCVTTIDSSYKFNGTSFTTGVLNCKSVAVPVFITVTDSRGRSATFNSTLSGLLYFVPNNCSVAVNRCDSSGNLKDDGTYIKVLYTYNICTLDLKKDLYNTKVVKIQWLNGSTWTDLYEITGAYATPADGTTVGPLTPTGGFSVDQQYQIRLYIQDYFETVTVERTLPTSFTLINYNASGRALAFGQVSTKDNFFEVGLDTQHHKNVYDRFGTNMSNGLSSYTGSGTSAIDPNTTIEHLILTDHANCPGDGFWYVKTEFYSTKSDTSNRMQTAYPYGNNSGMGPIYRFYYNSVWSDWTSSNEMILYDDANGSNGIIQPSFRFDTFSYIDIYYGFSTTTGNKYGGHTRITGPGAKTICLAITQSGTSGTPKMHFRSTTYSISSATSPSSNYSNVAPISDQWTYATLTSTGMTCQTGSSSIVNPIYIYRITGTL